MASPPEEHHVETRAGWKSRTVPVDELGTAIVPLFTVDSYAMTPRDFLGTGFIFPGGLLITCWHVVRGALADNLMVVAVEKAGEGPEEATAIYMPHIVERLSQDADGRDIASGRVGHTPRVRLGLSDASLGFGADVNTYGYPLTDTPTERTPRFQLNARYLEGYLTRIFLDEDRGYGATPAYELDMPAPAGLSGAPLFHLGSGVLDVVGMVYGVNEVHRIRWEEETSEGVRSEVRAIVTFSLAHLTQSLAAHRSEATDGNTVREYLRLITI